MIASNTDHPSYQRLLARASAVGSRALTPRGILRAVRGQAAPAPVALTHEAWRAHQETRRLRGRYRDPAAHASDVIDLLAEIDDALDSCQRRCSARLLGTEEVLRVIARAPRDTGREYVASSYSYAYSWTQAQSYICRDTIKWRVGRVSACYEMGDRAVHYVHRLTVAGAAWGGALLNGDRIAIHDRSLERVEGRRVYRRYDGAARCTGVACQLPEDLAGLHGWGCWEHAEDLAGLHEEIGHKRAVLASERARARETRRQERRTRLLARLSHRLTATVDDARSLGYCMTGIEAWCASRSIDPDSSISIRRLMDDPDTRAQRVALLVARRAIAQRTVAS